MSLTLKHGIFFGVAHGDCRLIGFFLVHSNGGLDISKLALVDELLLLSPFAIEELAADQALVFHI